MYFQIYFCSNLLKMGTFWAERLVSNVCGKNLGGAIFNRAFWIESGILIFRRILGRQMLIAIWINRVMYLECAINPDSHRDARPDLRNLARPAYN